MAREYARSVNTQPFKDHMHHTITDQPGAIARSIGRSPNQPRFSYILC